MVGLGEACVAELADTAELASGCTEYIVGDIQAASATLLEHDA